MKKLNIYGLLFCLLTIISMISSCTRLEERTANEDVNLQQVPVILSLTIDAVENATPETKAIMDPDIVSPSADHINNFVILQFNGVTGDATLYGGQQKYINHWPLYSMLDTSDPNYDASDVVSLVASDSPCTVVVLANTFGEIGGLNSSTTLSSFLEYDNYTTISSLSGVLVSSIGSSDGFFRMSGSMKLNSVGAYTSLSMTLKRNVAKIVINVRNTSSGTDAVTLSKVQLMDVNSKYYYWTHIASELTAEDANLEFQDKYNFSNPRRFDSDQEDFPEDNNPGGSLEGEYATYSFYVPANKRGTIVNSIQYRKGLEAPDGATRLCLYGTYGANDTPIIYTYYLGANLTDDFNILPNNKYTYNIEVSSKGHPEYDFRIEDMGEVKFTDDANSYMLHPPVISGQSRMYAIPVRRAAVFWNERTDVWPGKYGASSGDYSGYKWYSTTQWEAEVLWSDFDMSDYMDDEHPEKKFLQVASGTGFDPAPGAGHSGPYFKVKVFSGMKGNVVVAVKKTGASTILWSWHLWITDYNPDLQVTPVSETYIYPVTNGSIHRYNGEIWDTDPTSSRIGYKKGFSMDRNLGAFAILKDDPGSRGLVYQGGRKDPFLDRNQNNEENYFYLGGTVRAPVVGPSSNDDTRKIAYVTNAKNTRYTIMNPLVFIKGGRWTSEDDELGGNDNYWNDRLFWSHDGDQHVWEAKKSFYDPCPPGWKVPARYTYSDLTLPTAQEQQDGSYKTAHVYDEDGVQVRGRYYYPGTFNNVESKGRILFPYNGGRSPSDALRQLVDVTCNLWMLEKKMLYTYSSTISADGGANLAQGNNVRCVRE